MIRFFVRWFLDLRRRTAALLAAWAERVAPPAETPAMAVLRSRFPGAPEHWLAAIAARTSQPATSVPARAEERALQLVATPEAPRSIAKAALAALPPAPAKPQASVAFHPVHRLSVERVNESALPIRASRKEAAPAISPPRLRLHSNELPARAPELPKRPDSRSIAAGEPRPANPARPADPRPAVEWRRVASWTEEIDSPLQTHHDARRFIPSPLGERVSVRAPSRNAIVPERLKQAPRLVAERAPRHSDPLPGAESEMWRATDSTGLAEQETVPAAQDTPENASDRWPELPAPADHVPPDDAWLARERERERLGRLARDQMERSWNA